MDAGSSYEGMEATAVWRTEAANRINQYRKANLTVEVVDRNGTSIPNASISVQQQSHEFDFATAEKGKLMLNSTYQADILKYFNMVTFESDMVYDGWTNPQAYHITKPTELCTVTDWITANDLRLRWHTHTALWPRTNNLPPMTSATILENGIKAHIDEILNYDCLAGRIKEIDLLNEPVLNRQIETAFGYNTAITIYRNIFNYTKTNYPAIKLFSTDYVSLDVGSYRYISVDQSLFQKNVNGLLFYSLFLPYLLPSDAEAVLSFYVLLFLDSAHESLLMSHLVKSLPISSHLVCLSFADVLYRWWVHPLD